MQSRDKQESDIQRKELVIHKMIEPLYGLYNPLYPRIKNDNIYYADAMVISLDFVTFADVLILYLKSSQTLPGYISAKRSPK